MRKIVVSEFVSLDGVMQAPGGKKVFAEGARLNLKLVEARPIPSGVMLMRYMVDRPE